MMKVNIEIKAEHIDWKELVVKITDAVSEETTDISSVDFSFEETEEEIE